MIAVSVAHALAPTATVLAVYSHLVTLACVGVAIRVLAGWLR